MAGRGSPEMGTLAMLGVRVLAEQQLEHDQTEGPDVGAVRVLAAAQLLGRHVAPGRESTHLVGKHALHI